MAKFNSNKFHTTNGETHKHMHTHAHTYLHTRLKRRDSQIELKILKANQIQNYV